MSNNGNFYEEYSPIRTKMYLLLVILLLLTALVTFGVSKRVFDGSHALQKYQYGMIAEQERFVMMIDTLNMQISNIDSLVERLNQESENKEQIYNAISAAENYLRQIELAREDTLLNPLAKIIKANYEAKLQDFSNYIGAWSLPPGPPHSDCSAQIQQNRRLQSRLNSIQQSWSAWWDRNNPEGSQKINELSFKFTQDGLVRTCQIKRFGSISGDGKPITDYKLFQALGMSFQK